MAENLLRRNKVGDPKNPRFLELEFFKPVVFTPPGVLLGNLIGIPRKRIQI